MILFNNLKTFTFFAYLFLNVVKLLHGKRIVHGASSYLILTLVAKLIMKVQASWLKIFRFQAAWNVTNAIQGMFIVGLPIAVKVRHYMKIKQSHDTFDNEIRYYQCKYQSLAD